MSRGGSANYPAAARQVGAGDVGKRVTVRRAVPGGLSDIIGELQSFDGEYAEIRRADGDLVRVGCDDIVASRVVRLR